MSADEVALIDRVRQAMRSFEVVADMKGDRTVWCIHPRGRYGRRDIVAMYAGDDREAAEAWCERANARAAIDAVRNGGGL